MYFVRENAVRLAEFDNMRPDFPTSCHPDTVAMYEYWQGKCGVRSMPARSDIDPVDMPPRLLPFINLVDVVDDERRYVYRLVGSGDVEVRGQDPTGKSVLDGFFAPSAEDALSCYNRVVATRAPFLDPQPFVAPNGKYVTEETLFLPLSDDGTNVNKILVFSQTRDLRKFADFGSL
jgi:hypothetical protein